MLRPPDVVRDLGLLVTRLALAAIFIAHGLQKLLTWTLPGTAHVLHEQGVPLTSVAAPVSTVVELVAGVALLLGLFTTVAGALLVADMLALLVLVHLPYGLFASNGGYETVLGLAAGALAVAVGAGRWSLDALILRRLRRRPS
ncbi:DoxX family membrane protein [Raineyella fluvialis]|uniref:DoxX family membrane protein n=1 Tax=Raineyella fluvialis TaxID=2662261 RepID=A0A5Q2FL39_9ACTN|nr:DoxX family membrane protein [Raineyella fluvialis]